MQIVVPILLLGFLIILVLWSRKQEADRRLAGLEREVRQLHRRLEALEGRLVAWWATRIGMALGILTALFFGYLSCGFSLIEALDTFALIGSLALTLGGACFYVSQGRISAATVSLCGGYAVFTGLAVRSFVTEAPFAFPTGLLYLITLFAIIALADRIVVHRPVAPDAKAWPCSSSHAVTADEGTIDRMLPLWLASSGTTWAHGIAGLLILFITFTNNSSPLPKLTTVLWAVSASLPLLSGLIFRLQPYRLIGLIGLGLCIPHMFYYDIHEALHRIIAFGVLAIALRFHFSWTWKPRLRGKALSNILASGWLYATRDPVEGRAHPKTGPRGADKNKAKVTLTAWSRKV